MNKLLLFTILLNFQFLYYSRNAYLSIKSEPSDAKIVIDGEIVGTTPEILELKTGWLSILLMKDKYDSVW